MIACSNRILNEWNPVLTALVLVMLRRLGPSTFDYLFGRFALH